MKWLELWYWIWTESTMLEILPFRNFRLISYDIIGENIMEYRMMILIQYSCDNRIDKEY